jgi:secretion/DNA translocation related TadE-like protein
VSQPAYERGAGSVLVIGIIAALAIMTGVTLPLCAVLVSRATTAGAADAAAIAAADARRGIVAGYPCEVAGEVAAANRVTLTDCAVDGLVATVRVEQTILGFSVTGSASAGPPLDNTN